VISLPGAPRRVADLDERLLVGDRIDATIRRGKQMALVGASGRVLVVQLGMTGSVTIEQGPPPRGMDGKHRHVVWTLATEAFAAAGPRGTTEVRMAFRDPRRFGGLTAYGSRADLDRAWSRLGVDGLVVTGRDLRDSLVSSRRPIKSALLDQSVVAGVGNIYADESLFAAAIHPLTPAGSLPADRVDRLATEIRRILTHAADAGGSTLRDYRDAFGQPGSAVQFHAAYGREGEPCIRCRTRLQGLRIQGRATVFCARCQDLSTRR
jgi:formamidopyrimidine-DNA glycosylase